MFMLPKNIDLYWVSVS